MIALVLYLFGDAVWLRAWIRADERPPSWKSYALAPLVGLFWPAFVVAGVASLVRREP